MKATMRRLTEERDGSKAYRGDVLIKVGKREVITNLGNTLLNLMDGVKRVEFSNEYFPGSSEYKIRKDDMDDPVDGESFTPDGFVIEGRSARAWACAEGLRRLGVRGTVQKKLYVKIRR